MTTYKRGRPGADATDGAPINAPSEPPTPNARPLVLAEYCPYCAAYIGDIRMDEKLGQVCTWCGHASHTFAPLFAEAVKPGVGGERVVVQVQILATLRRACDLLELIADATEEKA